MQTNLIHAEKGSWGCRCGRVESQKTKHTLQNLVTIGIPSEPFLTLHRHINSTAAAIVKIAYRSPDRKARVQKVVALHVASEKVRAGCLQHEPSTASAGSNEAWPHGDLDKVAPIERPILRFQVVMRVRALV